MNQEEKLTISDWLSFLETRSGNYLSAMSIDAFIVAFVVSILGSSAELEMQLILIAIVLALMALHVLGSWMVGGSILVEVIEAKRISDRIVAGKLDTVGKIRKAWLERETSLLSWLEKKLE